MVPSSTNYVVFGASGGIGSALCRRLASGGARLLLAAREPSALHNLANELSAHAEPLDATDPKQVDHALTVAGDKFGRIDGVVNCVGSLLLKPAHFTTDTEWAETLTANLTSAFYVLRSAAGRMMRTGGGSIVLMSSAAASRGMINHEAIAAAKAGVVGLAQSAAATYARYNIRVNCVAPGLTRTPLTSLLTAGEVSLKASLALHPLGRLGEPGEVASAIAWLLHPEQQWMTGQVIGVDGGLSAVQPRFSSLA
jgi:3-oxoacyl-[acyl-carrier protein] reductase